MGLHHTSAILAKRTLPVYCIRADKVRGIVACVLLKSVANQPIQLARRAFNDITLHLDRFLLVS